ncbi:MAG: hypothetical protein LC674_02075, partial [Actinobacteria bacterium]|nr:hypothetical protein [Actinomycetota bacterium]
ILCCALGATVIVAKTLLFPLWQLQHGFLVELPLPDQIAVLLPLWAQVAWLDFGGPILLIVIWGGAAFAISKIKSRV